MRQCINLTAQPALQKHKILYMHQTFLLAHLSEAMRQCINLTAQPALQKHKILYMHQTFLLAHLSEATLS